jgi:hypothetical protein
MTVKTLLTTNGHVAAGGVARVRGASSTGSARSTSWTDHTAVAACFSAARHRARRPEGPSQ